MRIYRKTLAEFTLADLEQLVIDGLEETLHIDFKIDCYDFIDDITKQEKRIEFCKDVLGFANVAGGWIFCGIAETNGKASKLVGLDNFNPDTQKRRLGQWLDIDAQPRLHQFNTHTITLPDGKAIFIIEVPRSFAAPHRNKQTNEFPLRREARTEPNMTIDDLRRRFVGNASYAEQIRAFRRERVDAILEPSHAKSLTVIRDGPLLTVHILPIGMLEEPYRLSFSSFGFANKALEQSGKSNYFINGGQFNLDGVLLQITPPNTAPPAATEYFQVFRSGAIEYVRTNSDYLIGPPRPLSFQSLMEQALQGLVYGVKLQRSLDLYEPCFVAVTVAKTHTFNWKSDHSDRFLDPAPPMKHERLLLPEQYVEVWDQHPTAIMKPTFDIWANALGWPRSFRYNQNGVWWDINSLNIPAIE